MPIPRFRIRTLMIAVVSTALLLASIEYRARNMVGTSEWRARYSATVATLVNVAIILLAQFVMRRLLPKPGKPE